MFYIGIIEELVISFLIFLNFGNFNDFIELVWELSVFFVLQFVFGVIGNVIVLVVLGLFVKNYKWWLFYCFVCGLVIIDGGGILLVYFIVMIQYVENFMFDFLKVLCDYSLFIYIFILMFFVMIICVMFLDCFFVIFYLFVYNFENKGCCINCILVIIWLLGLFLFMLYLMGFGFSYNYYFWFWCFLNFVGGIIKDCINLFIYFIIGLFILLCIIVVNVVVILSVCRKMRCNSVKFV